MQFAILLFMAGAFAAHADDPDFSVIRWATLDAAPIFKPSVGPDGRPVISDPLLGYIIDKLAPVESRFEVWPLARILDSLKKGQQICFAYGSLSAERREFVYAVPATVTPSVSVVMRTELLRQHPEWRDGLSMVALIRRKDVRGAYLPGSNFGERWAERLVEAGENGVIRNFHGGPGAEWKLLQGGRVDFIFAYSEIIPRLEQSRQIEAGSLSAVTITDIGPVNPAYVLCPKTPWGKIASRRIDAALQELSKDSGARDRVSAEQMLVQPPSFGPLIEQFYRDRSKLAVRLVDQF